MDLQKNSRDREADDETSTIQTEVFICSTCFVFFVLNIGILRSQCMYSSSARLVTCMQYGTHRAGNSYPFAGPVLLAHTTNHLMLFFFLFSLKESYQYDNSIGHEYHSYTSD